MSPGAARWLALCVALTRAAASHAQEPREVGATALAAVPVPTGATALSAREAASHPAALGEPARALLDAPGVARSSFAGDNLVLWGASGSESRVYLDGVEVPKLFHPSGLRTTLHPALLRRVLLIPGAADANYGRGIGGVIEVTSRKRYAEGVHGTLRVDAIDASLASTAHTERIDALIAVRQGYLNLLAQRIFPDAEQVLALPSHTDAAARFNVRLDAHSSLSLLLLHTRDRTHIEREDGFSSVEQDVASAYQLTSLSFERRYADGSRMRVVPFVSLQRRDEQSVFSRVPLSLAQHGSAFGMRAEYVRPKARLETRLGLDARTEQSHIAREGTLTLPAREGDISVFGQAPVDSVATDTFHTWQTNVAPHLGLTFRYRQLELAPAIRLETYVLSASRATPSVRGVPALGSDRMHVYPEPRLRVSFSPSDWLALEARAGIYHQPPLASDLSAVFGTPTLAPSRAVHVSVGSRWRIPRDVGLELIGFYKALRDLAVRNPDSTPELAEALRATGHGSVWGASLALSRAVDEGLSLSAAYTLSRSLRSDPEGKTRRFDFDQPHVANAVVSYAWPRWRVSARARAASGNPRTPFSATYLDVKTGSVQPIFGAHNSERLPAFFQLDLHAERRFQWDPCALTILLDIWNVTNRANVEQLAFNADFSQRRDVRGLPLLAMLGLQLEL